MNKPTKFLVCRKVLPNLLEHFTKRAGPDILALQVQTVQPELVGVNLVCLWDWRSIIYLMSNLFLTMELGIS